MPTESVDELAAIRAEALSGPGDARWLRVVRFPFDCRALA